MNAVKIYLYLPVYSALVLHFFFLENSQNSQENTYARVSFLIKLQAKTLAQVFSCEFYDIFKKTFSTELLQTAASAFSK